MLQLSFIASLFLSREVSPLKEKQTGLAFIAKTSSKEDVCGICTMWLL